MGTKYRLHCSTEDGYFCTWGDSEPTECPNNPAHTLTAGSIIQLGTVDELQPLDGFGTIIAHGLDAAKEVKKFSIDVKTAQLIAPGFVFDSQTFSLSGNAQLNWTNIKANKAQFTFPLEISTKDNGAYSLAEADVDAFYNAGKDFIKGHLDSGRALKVSVNAAVDVAAVNAVVDNR